MDIPWTGWSLVRTKAVPGTLARPATRDGWFPVVREPYTGAWQSNVEIVLADVLTYSTVFSCVSLIASDIAKMRLRLVAQVLPNIWEEAESAAFSPVLRKPNRYQTRIKFVEQWILSKLTHGNTYVLKQRDQRGLVVALYVLDPQRVAVLVAPDGSVWYELKRDDLSGLGAEGLIVPASEIIHDVMVPLYHPLVGVSPVTACGLAAVMGLKIQTNSATLFANGSNPGGVLTAPGVITGETADRLKLYWDTNYTGANVGKVAVLGDGLKYEPMAINAVDAQLIDQLKWTSETVCCGFHVPPYMVGVGPPPNYNNIEALNQQYYSQCLQALVEAFELVLDEGLELPKPYGTEFDLDDLLRMDSATMMDVIARGVSAAIYSPNEGRAKVNLKPTPGGDTPYLQQQNYSLEALNRRDTQPAPATGTITPPAAEAVEDEDDDEPEDETKAFDVARFATAVDGTRAAWRSSMRLDDQIAAAVQTAIELATAPLRARIAVLETRAAQPPRDGRDGLPGPPGPIGEKGQDGTNGRDGTLTLDELQVAAADDGRTLTFASKAGAPLGTVTLAVVLDRGVYQATKAYAPGDGVSHDGSFWIAQAAMDAGVTPGAGATAWRLAVKKGRDGKAGKDGTPGKDGKEGAVGRPALNPVTGARW